MIADSMDSNFNQILDIELPVSQREFLVFIESRKRSKSRLGQVPAQLPDRGRKIDGRTAIDVGDMRTCRVLWLELLPGKSEELLGVGGMMLDLGMSILETCICMMTYRYHPASPGTAEGEVEKREREISFLADERNEYS
ncbi:hypothetical protein TRV_02115 [Trichophyton verrucosum HKI 0517]|uniref:Uncharacterized protein n=1 Tax=Trichophyton verrucosum (strain HKI 0517) TaxID=663202 RepID=D4D4U8_TRIVH|nr:uncharacterized protein TRV_02115 [Trichophyton verrucosum HKI 0517]EFE43110.1 hypothetical protein TRV_02115 [Trichophyton verrucosum HKI 0517]